MFCFCFGPSRISWSLTHFHGPSCIFTVPHAFPGSLVNCPASMCRLVLSFCFPHASPTSIVYVYASFYAFSAPTDFATPVPIFRARVECCRMHFVSSLVATEDISLVVWAPCMHVILGACMYAALTQEPLELGVFLKQPVLRGFGSIPRILRINHYPWLWTRHMQACTPCMVNNFKITCWAKHMPPHVSEFCYIPLCKCPCHVKSNQIKVYVCVHVCVESSHFNPK